jgi:hypothetical protein
MSILVAGGSGFIESNFIIDWLGVSDELAIADPPQLFAKESARLQLQLAKVAVSP